MHSKIRLIWVLGAALSLSACLDELHDDHSRTNGGTTALNQPPSITGSPSADVLEGEFYEFVPNASDPDDDELEFTIARKPAWARFNRQTGRLWGTPNADDVGNFTNIGIEVSDGQASAAIRAFDIAVSAIALGSATLSWNPPTENSDGTVLTNLAGYHIYYGRDPNHLAKSVELNNPGLTRFVIENLTPARWYFEMTSVDDEGFESHRSTAVSKTIT